MIEIRCPHCKRKLLECLGETVISIKCPKCKRIITIDTRVNKSDIRLPN